MMNGFPSKFSRDTVPSQLRAVPQWVCWKYEERDGKRTKVPVNPRTGTFASVTDASTWSSFEDALSAWAQNPSWDGVGFVFTSGDLLCGIDLDECISESGEVAPEAQRIIDALNSYTEVSPSGRGVKIFISGKKPEGAGCRSKAIDGFKETEVYDTDRFFTVTSRHVAGTPTTVESRQEQLTDFCARLWPQPAALPRQAEPGEPALPSSPRQASLSDDQIVECARRARNSAKFGALFDRGDAAGYGGDDSAADEALACLLAFWTRDAAQIERIMSRSPLCQREKWLSRPDYRDRTIGSALALVKESWGEGAAHRVRRGYPCTDLGNAERLSDRHRDDLRYCAELDQWFVWDGTRWRADRVGTPVHLVGRLARSLYHEATEVEDRVVAEAIGKWARKSEFRARIEAAVALARSMPELCVTVDQLDADPWAFNTLSGTIDLRTGELRPHRREDLITKFAPVEYTPMARSQRFESFLSRIMPSAPSRDYLLRFLGYSLSGRVDLQVLLMLWGVGANGKSVLLDTVKAIMGDYAGDAPPALLVTSRRDEHPTEIIDLCGKRLVVASETEQGASLKIELIKRLTGDATLKGRRMRQDFVEFSRTNKLVMATNNRPRIREDSEGVWRRIHLLHFGVVIPERERDPRLIEKLIEESPGILASLVRAGIDCHRDGLGPPSEVLDTTREYRETEDQVGRYLRERCDLDPAETPADMQNYTSWSGLYEDYAAWCADSGEHPMKGRRFGDALDRHGVLSATKRVQGSPSKVRMRVRIDDARDGAPFGGGA